jgi:aldehyde:ferredoxin oxidoreductase
MPLGYHGKILRVDLSGRKIEIEEPEETVYRRYLGGGSLASYYLLKELKPGIEPLAPENILIFATSVICGTPCGGASRFTTAAKSPLTGGYGEAEAGGWWGPELKFAGYDGIIITGCAEHPVYLWVHDEGVEIRDARPIWGMVSGEAQEAIRSELGDRRIRVALIGPAGEKLVRFSCVINELRHVNGRTGIGAVMGSKNLKAIAVRGKKKLRVHNWDEVKAISQWVAEHYERQPGSLYDLGTARNILPLNQRGILPTKNFISGEFDKATEISGERMKETLLTGRKSCYACPIRCKREVKVEGLCQVEPQYGGPEYETIASFGSLCGIGDIKTISKAHELCQKYTLDTISTGVTIAFVMECFERGIINKKDTDGIEISFGSKTALLTLIEKIAHRNGFGDVLAEGVFRAALKIGRGSEQYALHVKGQELPLHEPRGKTGLALAYALSPTGADHSEAPHDPIFEMPGKWLQSVAPIGILEPVESLDLGPKKVRLFFYLQQLFNLYNSVGLCNFVGIPFGPLPLDKLVDYVRAVTGWDTSLWELLKVGERAGAMARLFNVRDGFSPEDDTLPKRLFTPLQGGPMEGAKIDREEFKKALECYYQMAGWDPCTGIPLPAKLEELDIGWIYQNT